MSDLHYCMACASTPKSPPKRTPVLFIRDSSPLPQRQEHRPLQRVRDFLAVTHLVPRAPRFNSAEWS